MSPGAPGALGGYFPPISAYFWGPGGPVEAPPGGPWGGPGAPLFSLSWAAVAVDNTRYAYMCRTFTRYAELEEDGKEFSSPSTA